MVQAELFRKCFKGWAYLAGGCYGKVFEHPESDWIVKQATNDGTRTYLEWVMLKTQRGERMRGMPEIDFLVPIQEPEAAHKNDPGKYLVAMRRYEQLGQRLIDEFNFGQAHSIHTDPACPQYIVELKKAFEHDCPAVSASDMHYQNVMEDTRTGDFVLTDPSSSSYRPVGSANAARVFSQQYNPNEADVADFELCACE